MPRSIPLVATLLGVAGLIPFVACSLGALGLQGDDAARVTLALIGYGAVILAFLGGVHWGFALPTPDAPGPRQAQTARLALGIAPSLIGWLAVVLPLIAAPDLALAALIAGFVAAIALEVQARSRGLLTTGYLWLRWGLTACVLLCLAAVLAGRLIGIRIAL